MGANAILGVSMAVARAAADSVGLPLWRYLGGVQARVLPTPLMNIINGGVHADSGLEIQEFMIVPAGLPTFDEALRAGTEIFHTLKKLLKDKGHTVSVGDEGGFAPKLGVERRGHPVRGQARSRRPATSPARTCSSPSTAPRASSSTRRPASTRSTRSATTREELVAHLREALVGKYPIVSIEDGCAEDDWDGWKLSTQKLGAKVQLVGDDVFVTNVERLASAASRRAWPTPSSSSSTRSAR